MPDPWYRHQLIYCEVPDLQFVEQAGHPCPTPENRQEIADWAARGHPMVVTRPCFSPDGVWCGVPLYDRQSGIRRIRLQINPACIVRRADMPLLGEMLQRFPHLNTKRSLDELIAKADSCNVTLHCFGSHAWTYLTGYNYTHPASDLDLLVEIPEAACWPKFREVLESFPFAELSTRVDVEIRLERDLAFSWSEFQSATIDDSLFARTNGGYRLIRKSELPLTS